MRVHINAPSAIDVRLTRERCDTCERRTYMVRERYEWYATEWTCLRCGERYNSDEGRMPRPFRPRWREDSKRQARARYRRYRPVPTAPQEKSE